MAKVSKIGVYSCRTTLARLDKRTREGRLMRQIRADLLAHIGRDPTAVERMLIERAVMLSFQVAKMDEKIASGDLLTELDQRQYLAWSNSVVRCLARLGLDPKKAKGQQPSISEYLAAKAGGAAA